MDFDSIQTFHSIAETRNITKTAALLKLNKSTISRKLSQLELELGKQLFYKGGKEFSLTPYGDFFLKKTRNFISEIKLIEKVFKREESKTNDTLTISSSHALISTWLTRNLRPFTDLYPNTTIELRAETTEINQIWEHADLALRPYADGHPELKQEWIIQWTLQLYASEEYIKQWGTPASLSELDQHRIILFDELDPLYSETYTHWPLFVGTKFGNQRKPIIKVNSLQGMYNLVKDGIGIGVFERNSPLFLEKPLIPILPDLAHMNIEIYCIYPEDYDNFKSIRNFMNYLKTSTGLSL